MVVKNTIRTLDDHLTTSRADHTGGGITQGIGLLCRGAEIQDALIGVICQSQLPLIHPGYVVGEIEPVVNTQIHSSTVAGSGQYSRGGDRVLATEVESATQPQITTPQQAAGTEIQMAFQQGQSAALVSAIDQRQTGGLQGSSWIHHDRARAVADAQLTSPHATATENGQTLIRQIQAGQRADTGINPIETGQSASQIEARVIERERRTTVAGISQDRGVEGSPTTEQAATEPEIIPSLKVDVPTGRTGAGDGGRSEQISPGLNRHRAESLQMASQIDITLVAGNLQE